MDGIEFHKSLPEILKKYRYVLLILLIGLCFMLMPHSEEKEPEHTDLQRMEETSLQEELARILCQIEGAGKTKVLLTEAYGSKTYYQTDEDYTSSDSEIDRRNSTVLVTDSQRKETGLVQRIDPPTYQGAIVICQGADNARVRLSIVEAVANTTGLSTNRISVLKMK